MSYNQTKFPIKLQNLVSGEDIGVAPLLGGSTEDAFLKPPINSLYEWYTRLLQMKAKNIKKPCDEFKTVMMMDNTE